MCRDYGEVARLWVGIIKWRVLFDSDIENFVLTCRCRSREATDMRSFYHVLVDPIMR